MDYEDRFSRATSLTATPEQWARAMFGDVPSPGEWLAWRGALGLRLSSGRSPETVAGWRVTRREDERVRLEAKSWLMDARLLIETTGAAIAVTTSVQYNHWFARLWWPPLSAVHRALMPGVLEGAVKRRGSRRTQ